MTHIISNRVRINRHHAIRNNVPLLSSPLHEDHSPETFYRLLQYNYPKFFKMDPLSKWAWLGAESLLSANGSYLYDGMDKNNIAVVLMTSHGCLEADKRYKESMATIPSPALFVYTLPNIMLGEICIRHGFNGEQACLVNESFDTNELHFYVSDLLQNRGMDACLCGWVDVIAGNEDVCMYWISKESMKDISAAAMQQFYNG